MRDERNCLPSNTVAAAALDAPLGESNDDHPFVRHVNPQMAGLLAKLRLDKRFVRGEGCQLFDPSGRRYLDCIAAYGALPFGYNPPAIWRALDRARLHGEPSFVQPSLLDAAGQLAARLVELAPPGLNRVTFANSGAEAVEAAIKLCRAATGRPGILSAIGSFHGKTLGALSATGNPDYQRGFAAPAPDFHQVPYGDPDALKQALAGRPGYYAALLLEPIQGEGGIIEPPPGYLAAARALCDEAGVLLALDEIQTGLGRTGAMFACEAEGVVPDVLMLAKALGGGLMPIGAVLCTEEAFSTTFAMKHSSTFAGNCARLQGRPRDARSARARRGTTAGPGRPQRAAAPSSARRAGEALSPPDRRGPRARLHARDPPRGQPRPVAEQPPGHGRRSGLLRADLRQLHAQRRGREGRPDAQRQLRHQDRAAPDLPASGMRGTARGRSSAPSTPSPMGTRAGSSMPSRRASPRPPRSTGATRSRGPPPTRSRASRDSPSCSTRSTTDSTSSSTPRWRGSSRTTWRGSPAISRR